MSPGPTTAWRARLAARFDTAVLRPPPPATPWPPSAPAAFAALRDWCLDGAAPHRTRLLAVASLVGPVPAARELALQLCLERDGSLRMRQLGPLGRIALRLQTQANDLRAERPLQHSDPWDAGSLVTDASGLQALDRFAPRRPTLVLADGLDAGRLQTALARLKARQGGWVQPVRVLVLHTPPAGPDAPWPRFHIEAAAV